jgi:hypothetical protein
MYDSAINHRATRPVLGSAALDTAIDEARAELAALLRAPGGDARALMTWGERLMMFPEAGGLGQSGLHNLLELELLNRTEVPGGSWGSRGVRPTGLAAILV